MVRILAPVLVLLSLLLAAGLAACGSLMLQWRKKGEQGLAGGGGRLAARDLTETGSPSPTLERLVGLSVSVCDMGIQSPAGTFWIIQGSQR